MEKKGKRRRFSRLPNVFLILLVLVVLRFRGESPAHIAPFASLPRSESNPSCSPKQLFARMRKLVSKLKGLSFLELSVALCQRMVEDIQVAYCVVQRALFRHCGLCSICGFQHSAKLCQS